MAEISLALLNAISFTWRQANLKVGLDAVQNVVTISTPSSDAAKALSNVKQLRMSDTTHAVTLYGLAPDESPTALPLCFSEADILEQRECEIYACRRLGQSNVVVLTFADSRRRTLWLC